MPTELNELIELSQRKLALNVIKHQLRATHDDFIGRVSNVAASVQRTSSIFSSSNCALCRSYSSLQPASGLYFLRIISGKLRSLCELLSYVHITSGWLCDFKVLTHITL